MNAAEFNTETKKLNERALKDGVFAGKMSAAEMVGIIELMKNQIANIINAQAVANAQKPQPLILPQPNGFKAPPRG
jgi:hypothetical protein